MKRACADRADRLNLLIFACAPPDAPIRIYAGNGGEVRADNDKWKMQWEIFDKCDICTIIYIFGFLQKGIYIILIYWFCIIKL